MERRETNITVEEYMIQRVDDQIQWYDSQSQKAQKFYKRLQIAELVLAALVPILAPYAKYGICACIIASCGSGVVVLNGISKLNRYHENWIQYRTTSELLKSEKFLFQTKAGPYSSQPESTEKIFIHNIENLISSENNQWKNLNLKDVPQEKKSDIGS